MQVTLDAHYGFAPAIVRALVHSLWQVALLAFLAAVSFALLRRRSAGLRHAVGMLYLLAMTVAPLVTFALCWRVPAMSLKVGARAAATALPATGLGAVLDLNQSWSDWIPLGVTLVWTLGVALMLLRQIGGWQFIRRLQQQPYSELSPAWHKRVQVLRLALGISRAVTVRLADHVVSPFTAHFLRPLIWLPVSLLTQLPPQQIEALLAHELAHIRRLDWLWNGMQCVVEAMLFYHPGMWWLSRRIRQERELACDDLAVAVCGDPIALAEALAALEHQRLPNSRFVLAAQGGSLMKRITHLLSSQPAHQSWRVPGALLALLCSGTLCAAQIDSSSQFLTHLKFQSTIDSSGTVREITAEGLDRQRYYRASTDSQGHTTEIYQEDGRPKPIDNRVRLWLDQVSRRSVAPSPMPSPSAAALAGIVARPAAPPPATPAPTAPPAPAALPTPDALVSPALPPMPPSIASADEFSGLLSSLNTDRRLVAITGSPAVVEPDTFRGRFDTGAASGFNLVDGAAPRAARADFVLIFSGPKGRAVVQYAGKVQDGSWHVSKLSFQPAGTRAKAGASVVADMQTEISEEAAAHAREQAEEAVAQAAEQAREQTNAAEEAGREAKQRVAEAVAQAKEQAAEAEQEGKQAIQQAKEAVAQAQEQAMEAAQESKQAAQQAKQEVAQAQAQAAEAEQEGKQAMQQAKREVAQAQEQAARAAQAGERERQRGADAVARAEVQVAQAQKLAQAAMQRAHAAAVRALQHPLDSATAADTEQ